MVSDRASSIDAHGPLAGDDVAVHRLRQRARRTRGRSAGATQSISVHLITTVAGGERLLGAVASGVEEFTVVSDDGKLAVRVRLAVDSMQVAEECLGASEVVVDWSRGTVANGESRVRLARMELRLLAALVERNGKPISKTQLAARLWPTAGGAVDKENGLAVYVCGLRKRLAAIGLASALQTVRGIGYRLLV